MYCGNTEIPYGLKSFILFFNVNILSSRVGEMKRVTNSWCFIVI